jgi:2-keto-4-pentenoate hydratase/2-oxohepta-3-ene-1,7-dioic acid hydratase in catechol pathway
LYFATFSQDGREDIGILTKSRDKIVSFREILGQDAPETMLEFIENFNPNWLEVLENIDEARGIELEKVKLEAPIPNPRRGIICLGKNYKEHAEEISRAGGGQEGLPEHPIYFCKLVDRAIGHGGYIPVHSGVTSQLDYEVELAVVIGKEGRNIPREKVEDYIFGYTILNDITARDLQKQHSQWFRGKSLDGFCPMGPYLAYKTVVSFPPELDIRSYVNGELRQNANTRDFIFDLSYIISEFSKGITLKAGDIISTGTPAGVGMGFSPFKFLRSGDEVECWIENLGSLKNFVR